LLTDFGISKSEPNAPERLTTSGPLAAAEAGQMPIASIEYSSPEHLLGRATDARSDEYALGIVAYEMLTRHVPFRLDPERMYTMVLRMLTEQPVPPSRIASQPLSPDVDAILLKALAADPAQRYPTPGACAEELNRLVRTSQELTLPAPPGSLAAPEILPPESEEPPRPTVADWRQHVPEAAQDMEDEWTQPLSKVSKRRRGRLGFLTLRRRR
jgi:serine/threonine-protein kinase